MQPSSVTIVFMCQDVFLEFLIDDILCKADFTIKPTTARILLNKLSDHQTCFVLLDTTFARSHNPKFTRKHVQLEDVITNIKKEHISAAKQ